MKTKRLSRVVSLILATAMLCTMAVSGAGAASAANDTYEKTNLIADPGFDLPDGFVTNNEIGRWNNWLVQQSKTGGRGGSSCVKFNDDAQSRVDGSGLRYNIDGSTLQPGMTYTFSIWAKVERGDDILEISVKDYAGQGSKTMVKAAGNEWRQYSVEFTFTGGNPVLDLYNNVWNEGKELAVAYVDDASLVSASPVEGAHIENGVITVTGEGLNLSGFTAVYTSSLNPGDAKILELTEKDGKLTFAPIAAAPLAQTITVILTYEGESINLSFEIAASGEAVIPTQVDEVDVVNGVATITLKEVPTMAPTAGDFRFDLKVDGGKAAFRMTGLAYDNSRTVTVSFEPVSASLSADRIVELTVTAGGVSAADGFTVEKGTRRTYYVSSSAGSDLNDGLTPETPFQTIDKLNTLNFVPGDYILFKTGDTFVGMLRPSGSGTEGAPIVVSSYGEGERPVLQPDPEGVFEYALGAGSVVTRRVNGTIWLENVDHWEIRDLELHDPSYDPEFYLVGNLEVYNAAVRVVNVDQGDLSHFVFDNLVIHGFRGPGINAGKTSGGIQFNVGTQAAVPVPSCFVDVSITNCEIYQCGRDGVNSLSVWGYRRYTDTGSAWPSFPSAEYNSKYSYYPSRNFYMANCSIHEIDGDGLIVDSWFNAVAENNTVSHCAIHISDPFRAAVGMFNWNSDNVVFQYNECYANGTNATRHKVGDTNVEQGVIIQDGQGIEVDALNQNTWVQYNYLHDNAAFMMLCTESAMYTSINTYIRYNVTENDGCNLPNTNGGMSWFLNGSSGINTQVYNNTCILGSSALKNNQLYLLKYNSGQYRFYNNIFCYTGDTPVGVTSWQDSGDWQSNLFINITGLPAEDDAAHPNLSLTREEGEALFAGGSGADAYRLTSGAYSGKGAILPSMDDGMFSGVDLAGSAVPSAPGIGAFEYAG